MWSAHAFVLYYIWLFRKRHLFTTFVQIVGPVLIIAIFTVTAHQQYVLLDLEDSSKDAGRLTVDELTSTIASDKSDCPLDQSQFITYYATAGSENFAENMVNEMRQKYFNATKFSKLQFRRVQSEKEILKFAVVHHALDIDECYIGGLVFQNDPLAPSSRSAVELRVKIRMAHCKPDETGSLLKRSVYFNPVEYPLDYEPFLGFQVILTRTFFDLYARASKNGSVNISDHSCAKLRTSVQPFPVKGIYHYGFRTSNVHPVHVIIAVAIVLGQTFMVMSLVWGPALDKQTGFRTYLRLLGVSRGTYWALWWWNDFFVRIVVSVLQTAMLFTDLSPASTHLVRRGNFYIWLGFLLAYNMASISFFIFMASFNKRGLTATYLAATIWLLSYYVGDLFMISKYYDSTWRAGVLLMCLNPNSALILGCILMTNRVDGAQWYALATRSERHEVSPLEVFLILLGDALLYFILALYGDTFRPERHSAKCWQHCCTSIRVHARDCVGRVKGVIEHLFCGDNADSVASEIMPCHDIVFTNVTFGFEKRVKVLEDVSIQIVDKKRTAIVGPGGAGKTAFARLICGAFPPNSGTILVGGYHSVIHRHLTRRVLSICPEQNLLCDYITLFEHLKLVGRLRGYRISRVSRKARKMLEALELTEYSNEFPHNLVGIQKRKLCVALALIGNPKIVVFDNPTDGMDLESTFQMLKFISTYCQDKTSLLLTSNLSEAYYFAERIAILSNARILGSGTKEQLESCLKTGYHLQLTLEPDADPEAVHRFVAEHISEVQKLEKQSLRIQAALELVETEFYEPFVSPHARTSETRSSEDVITQKASRRSAAVSLPNLNIPDFELTSTKAPPNTLTLVLPRSEAHKFADLFALLESSAARKQRGIMGYKLLPYTIEVAYDEVENYMRLSDVKEDIERKGEIRETTQNLLAKHHAERLYWKTCQRLKALIVKRLAYLFSVWLHTLFQFIVPLMLLVAISDATSYSFGTQLEGHVIHDSLDQYPDPVSLVKRSSTSDSTLANFYSRYKNLVGSHRIQEIKSFEEKMKDVQSKSEDELTSKYVVGLELKPEETIAFFSPLAFHAGPTSLSLVLNSFLQCVDSDLSANFEAHAIVSDTREILKYYLPPDPSPDTRPAMMYALILAFGFFVYTSRFICQPLAERTILLKNLQLNTGLNAFTYWFGYFICDATYTLILTTVTYSTALLVPPHPALRLAIRRFLPSTFFLFAALSSILQSYAFSFIFTQPTTSFFAMLSYNQVAGIFLFVLNTFVSGTPGNVLKIISRISQPYNVNSGFFNLLDITIHNARCDLINRTVRESICDTNWDAYGVNGTDTLNRSCCDYYKTGKWKYTKPFFPLGLSLANQHESPTVDLVFLILHAIAAIAYISFMEGVWCRRCTRKHKSVQQQPHFDAHIQMEDEESTFTLLKKARVSMRNRRHLYVESLSKRFFFGSEVLSGISFSASPGELIAIIGPPHSGKSVLIRILTGNLRATRGLIQFKLPSGTKRANYLKYMGFTPSDEVVNAFPNMKGITLLKVFARLRGIPDSQLKAHVNKWTTLLGLQKRLNQDCEHYTATVRSKLALALALVGDPPILVLDEPFRGLDPFFKNQLWTILDYLRKETGRIVILASSGIEEVAFACSRAIVLVNGGMHCYLTPEQLMRTYGGGFLITFKIKEETSFKDCNALKSRIQSDFPGIILLSEGVNMLEYRLLAPKKVRMDDSKQQVSAADKKEEKGDTKADEKPESQLAWSQIFKVCQKVYEDNTAIVTEYNVSEETPQDIYNRFASKQLPYNQPIGSREEFCTTYC